MRAATATLPLAIESGGVRAEWDAARALFRMHMLPGCAPTADDANRIADALEAWTGLDSPVDAIVDCEGATGFYVGWRVAWTTRIRRHPRRVRMAYTRLGTMSASVMPLFAYLSGVDARHFADERAALAWLGR